MALYTLLIALLSVGFFSSGYGAGDSHPSKDPHELVVFAAASLHQAFRAIAGEFQSANPGTRVIFNFAGSQQLVQQIGQGATFDVIATANTKQMDFALSMGSIDSASVRVFTLNRLAILYHEAAGVRMESIADLASPNLRVILADKSVPVGQYAVDFLNNCSSRGHLGPEFTATVLQRVISYEDNVKSVVSKVILGEADAGIVYTSDLTNITDEQVHTIAIPESLNVIAKYPAAVAKGTKYRELAESFVQYLVSERGQALLGKFGFTPVSLPMKRQ